LKLEQILKIIARGGFRGRDVGVGVTGFVLGGQSGDGQ
jgi:hypothetical protein